MSPGELLNSDLGTIGRELRRGFDWWVEELAALVPPAVRQWRTMPRTVLRFDGADGFGLADGEAPSAAARHGATIVVPRENVLIREVATPPMTRSDFDRMLMLNTERYLPLPGGTVVVASAIRSERRDDAMMVTDLAAMPLALAQRLARALGVAGIAPRSVCVAGGPLPDSRFDLLPAMRSAGLIPATGARAQIWWILVGFLALLNVATAVWRDVADVGHLESLVEMQRPAVIVAQRMTAQMRGAAGIAHAAVERRRTHDALGMLAVTTAAVPDGAWVQRYGWDGAALRLTGYRSRDADVAAALRRVPGLANVKSAQTDSIAEIVAGQPFDLVAEIRPH